MRLDGGCGGVGGLGLVSGVTRKPTPLPRPAWNVRVELLATHGRGSRPSQSSRNSENRRDASVQPIVAESITVIVYGPFGSCMPPMRSLCKTSKVPGQLYCAAEAAGAVTATAASTATRAVKILLVRVMGGHPKG